MARNSEQSPATPAKLSVESAASKKDSKPGRGRMTAVDKAPAKVNYPTSSVTTPPAPIPTTHASGGNGVDHVPASNKLINPQRNAANDDAAATADERSTTPRAATQQFSLVTMVGLFSIYLPFPHCIHPYIHISMYDFIMCRLP
jgi:hypothetical protein